MDCQFLRTLVVRKWKKLRNTCKVFKSNGLDVIIECNMKVVNYLDLRFNLNDGAYRPYQKPDNIIQYIMSNLTTLQVSLSKSPKQSKNASLRKNRKKLSFNEEIFNESMNQHPFMKTNYTSLASNKR